jgi:hypothetical protein
LSQQRHLHDNKAILTRVSTINLTAMALLKKIKKALYQLPTRRHKKPEKNQGVTKTVQQPNVIPDYDLIDSETTREAEPHRTTPLNMMESTNYLRNTSLLAPHPSYLDILVLDEIESNTSSSQTFDETGESCIESEFFSIENTSIGGISDAQDLECDIHDEDSTSNSFSLSRTSVASLKEEEGEFSEDDGVVVGNEVEEEEVEGVGFTTTEDIKTPRNHPFSTYETSKLTPRANHQDILAFDSSPSNDSLASGGVFTEDSIESHNALQNVCFVQSSGFVDLGFDIESVIFTDVNAMARHFSRAEKGKRIAVNPWRLEVECVEDVIAMVEEGEFDHDAKELTEREIEGIEK